MLTRTRLLWLLALTLAAFAMNVISSQEVARLYVPAGNEDQHFARVWVADAPPFVWIRVTPTTRNWIESAGEQPNVTLWRGEQELHLRARIWEQGEGAAYVDPLFRAKYGLMDSVRSWLGSGATVLVRLEPR
jgi:hypothetical protein